MRLRVSLSVLYYPQQNPNFSLKLQPQKKPTKKIIYFFSKTHIYTTSASSGLITCQVLILSPVILFRRMACASQAVMAAANTCTFPKQRWFKNKYQSVSKVRASSLFTVKASTEDSDCNVEECAPDKEVGKVSMEWLAGEKTKVIGTFPPRKQGWTGYVEKDTAGQTNIYSVEPAVYVAESAISSGIAGSSSDGAENTLAIAGFFALISIAAASTVLLQVGKTPPQMLTADYSGPSLSYYVNKFKPQEIIQASAPSQSDSLSSVREDIPDMEAPQIDVNSQIQPKS